MYKKTIKAYYFRKVIKKMALVVTFFLYSIQSYSQIIDREEVDIVPFRMSLSTGVSIPIGGVNIISKSPPIYKGFNVLKTHNPAISLAFLAECPWRDNWFLLDSIYVGTRITTNLFFAKNKSDNENLWINTFYLSLSRSYDFSDFYPYIRIGIGGSTLFTSLNAFVISGGGSLSLGSRFNYNGHHFGIETSLNAPLIAYRNKLTSYMEFSFLYLFHYDYLKSKKIHTNPSF